MIYFLSSLCSKYKIYFKILYFQGNFVSCENLKIIYLQNNDINKIENLHFANNLSELYLQHNNLTKIENLDSLRNLKKLYLGYNKIAIVEGLENLASLRELYIEKQRLSPGESLCFEPRSCLTLAVIYYSYYYY